MLMDTRPPRGFGGGAEPWRDEPDRLAWRDPSTGLQCLILRDLLLGHLCGYVRVPRGHPLHGRHEDVRCIRRRVRVHGGLNFSGCFRGRYMKRGHWFGFDCCHASDLAPYMADLYEKARRRFGDFPAPFSALDGVYRDMNYVRGQCTALAQQLAQLGASR